MSRILYISAANYDRKHLENSKIGLENSQIFFLQISGNPSTCMSVVMLYDIYYGTNKDRWIDVKLNQHDKYLYMAAQLTARPSTRWLVARR